MTDFQEIRSNLDGVSPGESVEITDAELPTEFERTIFGTPLWIAHPGATAQYRASPALHAYEFPGRRFRVHRDEFDPGDHPFLHALFDAPEVVLAGLAAAIAGFLTWLFMERRERGKKEEDRLSWLPAFAAMAVAAIVGVVAYILGAIVRVALSAD